jgi:hypothetical protein
MAENRRRVGGSILEKLITILQNGKVDDGHAFLNHLKQEGRLRLLEAGKDQRIYQFISYAGLRMKLRLDSNGRIEVLP